jgi:hypothetical protein
MRGNLFGNDATDKSMWLLIGAAFALYAIVAYWPELSGMWK